MNRVQVIIDGIKLDERKTGRTYPFALVCTRYSKSEYDRTGDRAVETIVPCEPYKLVYSFHGSEVLAKKAAGAMARADWAAKFYRDWTIVPTTTVEVKKRKLGAAIVQPAAPEVPAGTTLVGGAWDKENPAPCPACSKAGFLVCNGPHISDEAIAALPKYGDVVGSPFRVEVQAD